MSKLERTLIKFGDELVYGLRSNLEAEDSNASGNLKASIEYKAKVTTDKNYKFSFSFSLLMDSYWYYVDQGRKPGTMPPISSIVNWIRNKESFTVKPQKKIKKVAVKINKTSGAKGIINKTSGAKNIVNKKKGAINYKGIAYAIALKIKKQGTRATKFYSKIVDQKYIDTFSKRIEEAMFIDIEDQITTRIV